MAQTRLLGGEFQDGTDLDRPVAGPGDLGRQLQRLVQVVALQQVPAAQLLRTLDRRAVADLGVAVADPDTGGIRDPLQRLPLLDPLRGTREQVGQMIGECNSVIELFAALGR